MFEPYPWQKYFANCPSPRKLAMCANRVGATTVLRELVRMYATGDYPKWFSGHKWPSRVDIAVVAENLDQCFGIMSATPGMSGRYPWIFGEGGMVWPLPTSMPIPNDIGIGFPSSFDIVICDGVPWSDEDIPFVAERIRLGREVVATVCPHLSKPKLGKLFHGFDMRNISWADSLLLDKAYYIKACEMFPVTEAFRLTGEPPID